MDFILIPRPILLIINHCRSYTAPQTSLTSCELPDNTSIPGGDAALTLCSPQLQMRCALEPDSSGLDSSDAEFIRWTIYKPRTTNHDLRTTTYKLRTTNHETCETPKLVTHRFVLYLYKAVEISPPHVKARLNFRVK
jgi:hypothetical protein